MSQKRFIPTKIGANWSCSRNHKM